MHVAAAFCAEAYEMTDRAVPQARAWQRMLSGRRLDLLAPSPDDIDIEDIAHGLARVARWNGQTIGDHAFSVAQHSLLVANIAVGLDAKLDKRAELAVLLHDAPEYVIGDLISPFKAALSLDYKTFERRLLDAIHEKYDIGVLPDHVQLFIKKADRIAAYFEATCLAGFSILEAKHIFGDPAPSPQLAGLSNSLSPWPANIAQREFLYRFHHIRSA